MRRGEKSPCPEEEAAASETAAPSRRGSVNAARKNMGKRPPHTGGRVVTAADSTQEAVAAAQRIPGLSADAAASFDRDEPPQPARDGPRPLQLAARAEAVRFPAYRTPSRFSTGAASGGRRGREQPEVASQAIPEAIIDGRKDASWASGNAPRTTAQAKNPRNSEEGHRPPGATPK